MTDQELISQYKSSSPGSFVANAPTPPVTGWYSDVQKGAYRPTGNDATNGSADTSPLESMRQKADSEANKGGDSAIFGNEKGSAAEEILKNTAGSGGVGGLIGKPIVAAATAGATEDVATHKQQLNEVTQSVLNKIKTMSPDDPKRAGLLEVVKENQKAMGISDEVMKELGNVQETQSENLGTALNAASTLAGGAAAGEAATEAGAKTLGQQIAHGATTGAEVGATQGAGTELQNKDATAGSVIKASLEGGGAGALTGGALEGIIPNVPKILTKAKNGATVAVNAPISAASDIATPIDKNVLAILQNPNSETESTLKDMFTTAKNAVSETGSATPFDIVGKKNFGGALDDLNKELSMTGNAKSEALSRVGARDIAPNVSEIKNEFTKEVESKLGTSIDDEGDLGDAKGRTSLVSHSPGDARLIKQVNSMFDKISNPGKEGTSVQKVNDAIDAIQSALYQSKQVGAQPITSQTDGLMRQIIGKLNGIVKGATEEIGKDGETINPYAETNAKYAKLVQLKTDLNTRLGNNMKNAGSMTKRIFSPQDVGTKDLVKQLEAITGRPIFHDATMAKFAMDSVGDPRAQSLLQQGMNAKSKGFYQAVLDFVKNRLEDPEGKATRILKKSKK